MLQSRLRITWEYGILRTCGHLGQSGNITQQIQLPEGSTGLFRLSTDLGKCRLSFTFLARQSQSKGARCQELGSGSRLSLAVQTLTRGLGFPSVKWAQALLCQLFEIMSVK